MSISFSALIKIGLLFLANTSVTAQQPNTPAETPPGRLVDIGGHRLHIHCVGAEGTGPLVVFESGGGGSAKDWTKVREALRAGVRSCAYDRAGAGWSEPGPKPRTMRQEVFELHALLEKANISGPIILVGQSIGGLLVRMYMERFGTNVVGVVLVDPTHESSMLGSARYGGWVRLREKATGRPLPEPQLKGDDNSSMEAGVDYLAEEFQQIHQARQSNPQPLGDRPLIVLGAGKRKQPPGTPDDMWENIRREKEEQVRDQARLSRNSKFVNDPSSGHNLHIENPPLVAQAIHDVLDAITQGKKIEP
jgi:pimeloyl-ACP methyl ester carboxylesterase